VVVVLVLPFVLIVFVALVAFVFVRSSSLHITSAGVEIRNFPQPAKLIPLAQVGHFEATPRVGNFRSLRPATAVLVLSDGTRVPVRTVAAPEAGFGIDALNQRVEALRFQM
jgi:hypothetical protein